jgi:hypothetical protein
VDVVLVIGANDTVNPAARHDRQSPIFGMPILDVDEARSVIVIKRSLRSGFSGIENELFFLPRTMMLCARWQAGSPTSSPPSAARSERPAAGPSGTHGESEHTTSRRKHGPAAREATRDYAVDDPTRCSCGGRPAKGGCAVHVMRT